MQDFDVRVFMAAVRKESGAYDREPLSFWEIVALLRLRDEAFLTVAYRDILFRAVDPTGKADYLPRARTLLGRLRILLALMTSPENVHVPRLLRSFLIPLRAIKRRLTHR
ncbi:MAG: DUF4214 domain-containing protein [Desulfovibrionaceae bacterium]|nr:DUF4214 domain-containing protein [Desulfovibrionaceae bacterium]